MVNTSHHVSNQKKDIKQGSEKRNRGLKGILWELLGLQVKITVIAFTITIILLFIMYSFFADNISSPYISSELNTQPVIYGLILLSIAIIYLGTAWFFTYSYGASLKRTITQLIHQIKQFQMGSLRKIESIQRGDELGKLSEQLNALTDDVEQQIVSMRRVLNENAQLISEAERAASLEERRKLARDLHDAVSQELFAVSMSLGAMPRLLDKKPEKVKPLFQQIEKMVHHSQQELRALIMHLRPVTLDGKGLNQAMDTLFNELKIKHPNLDVVWELQHFPPLDPGVEEQLFRVLQEGISNSLRHGNPEKIHFSYSNKGDRLLLVLEDDGVGFDMEELKSKQNVSYGLRSMKERIVELGGHFSILSYPNKGTKLEIRIPIVNSEKSGEAEVDE
ncbi:MULTISPECIES: sensor histidine kinase [Bacillaceae]|uniref:histidine kinase n=1 Tax=Evansella alkalicola TaxID=745819 RepID=A0ABS6JXG4_9BACI|nr:MULTISPECIES: sensor histidine kinase [Bacillaceae]MBU9721800.1 sensor histidine kinase [Bacillus alkalicola]